MIPALLLAVLVLTFLIRRQMREDAFQREGSRDLHYLKECERKGISSVPED